MKYSRHVCRLGDRPRRRTKRAEETARQGGVIIITITIRGAERFITIRLAGWQKWH